MDLPWLVEYHCSYHSQNPKVTGCLSTAVGFGERSIDASLVSRIIPEVKAFGNFYSILFLPIEIRDCCSSMPTALKEFNVDGDW